MLQDYTVLNFSTTYHNSNKISTAGDLFKEIIIAIYNLTNEDVFNILNNIEFKNNVKIDAYVQNALEMIKKFNSVNNSNDCINLIDKYIDIIYAKIASKKYLIAIDNVQFFDDSISYFFNKIIEHALISQTTNNSCILLTFNLDYMTDKSCTSDLLATIQEKDTKIYAKKVTGFQNNLECEEYLQEVLNIGATIEREYINEIIDKTDMNPFFANQLVEHLYERRILNKENGQYNIQNAKEFRKAVSEVPENIYTLIKQRWQFYCNNNNIEEDLLVLSAIHFFKQLSLKDFKKLNLFDSNISKLKNSNFIEENDIGIFGFTHDLIENFFVREYNFLSEKILKYIKNNNIKIKFSEFQHHFYEIYNNEIKEYTQLERLLHIDVDKKLQGEYYSLLVDKFLDLFDNFTEKILWIKDITLILENIRDAMGNEYMLSKWSEINKYLNSDKILNKTIEYGVLIMAISETLDSVGKYSEAYNLLDKYRISIDKDDNLKDDITYKKIICDIHNRMHVYRRHQCENPINDKIAMSHINKSYDLCYELDYFKMQYVNNSDYGYLFYALPKDKISYDKTTNYWNNACQIYDIHNIKEKTLNYYRKKVQLALIEGDYESAIENCNFGIHYIDHGEYAYQKLLFKWWFHLALATTYLQNAPTENLIQINECLNKAQDYADLLNTNKSFYVLQLRSIYYYYKKTIKSAKNLSIECRNIVSNSNYKAKQNILLKQLEGNEEVFISKAESPVNQYLTSMITTKDKLFNLPCL